MFDFHEKRKARNILYSKGVLFILFVFLILLSYAVFGAMQKEKETRVIKEQRQEVLDELEVREETLSVEIDRLSTDRGIEAEIRSKFEVAKDGEEVIVIVEGPEDEIEPEIVEEESVSWFRRLFGG